MHGLSTMKRLNDEAARREKADAKTTNNANDTVRLKSFVFNDYSTEGFTDTLKRAVVALSEDDYLYDPDVLVAAAVLKDIIVDLEAR